SGDDSPPRDRLRAVGEDAGSWQAAPGPSAAPTRPPDGAVRARARSRDDDEDRQAQQACGRCRRLSGSYPAFDLEAARLLGLLAGDVAQGRGERPDMPRGAPRGVGRVAVELVGRLCEEGRACRPCPRAMSVDVFLKMHMARLRCDAPRRSRALVAFG